MSKHTPGPWEILEVTPDDWQINSDLRDDCLVQMTPTIGHEHLSDEDKANARLIAAAPDMLAALEQVSRMWRVLRDEGMLNMVEEAIAKAQGVNDE